eukprot:symbB.v1.2.029078.t1/scaffold3138.1/size62594/1
MISPEFPVLTESQLESFDFDTLKIAQNMCQSNETPVPSIEKRLLASEKMLREIEKNRSLIKREEPGDGHTPEHEEVPVQTEKDFDAGSILPEVIYILRRVESILAMNEKDASGDQEDKKKQQQEKKHDEAEAESKAGASPEQEEPEIAPNTKEIPSAAQEQVPEDGNKTAAAAEEADAEAETQLQTEIPEDNTAKASEVEVAEEAPAPTTSNSVAEAEISGKCPSETTTAQSKDEMAKHDSKNETLPRPPSPTLGTMESQKQKQEEQDKDNQEAEQRQEEQDKENQKQGQDEQDKENQKQRQGEQEKNENENEADQKQEDEQNKGNKKKEEDGKKDDEKKEENKKNEEDQKKDEKKNEEKQKKRKIDEEQEKQDSDEQRKKQRHKQEKEDEVKKGKGEGDFYSILGVSVDASESDIKKAWKSSSLRLHPDKTGGTTTNEFQRLQMAYETLSDVNKRKAYDRTLAANTAKILRRRTTAGDDSGSDFENGTSFMATVGRWSRKVQKEEDAKKAKKEKAKNEKEKKNKEKKTKATAKSPKAKAMPKLKTKASAAPKKKSSPKKSFSSAGIWESSLDLNVSGESGVDDWKVECDNDAEPEPTIEIEVEVADEDGEMEEEEDVTHQPFTVTPLMIAVAEREAEGWRAIADALKALMLHQQQSNRQ